MQGLGEAGAGTQRRLGSRQGTTERRQFREVTEIWRRSDDKEHQHSVPTCLGSQSVLPHRLGSDWLRKAGRIEVQWAESGWLQSPGETEWSGVRKLLGGGVTIALTLW